MLARLLPLAQKDPDRSGSRRRLRRLLFTVVAIVCCIAAAGYHTAIWSAQEPASVAVRFVYHVVVLLGFTALWLLLSDVFRQRQATPVKIFWTTLLVALLYLGLSRLLASVGLPAGVPVADGADVGFELGTGVPLTLVTVVQMTSLGLLKATFVFFLLLRFRDLVLFKRTRQSQRNWYLMLALMAAASLFAFMKAPTDKNYDILLQAVPMVPAIALMVINSFRLSWIVFLSFREKLAGIGFSVILLAALVLALRSLGPGGDAFLRHFSYPLKLFTDLGLIFGTLYCVTSFLSLLFHLPTTSDFQRKAGEVTAMHSLTNLVGQVFDPEMLYRTIVASPVEAVGAASAWLAMADPQSGTLRPRLAASFNIPTTRVAEAVDTTALYADVYASREALLLDEAPADHRVDLQPGEGIGSLLVVPLVARDEMLGALFVTKDVTHGFEKDDEEAIGVFAAQAALALDNARLFEEQVDKERLARELDIAREVQRKLLPQCLPFFSGLSLCASSVSAQEVGGDYYDFLEIDEDRLAFIVADVSGKGTSAAFYMAELQGIFRALSPLVPSPASFLTHANRALAGSLEKHVFISVIYGMLDLKEEELVLVRGGHCPAATINLDGEARFIRSRGLGLGLDRGALFERALVEERLPLQPGDVFALYTDGVVESRNAAGEEYGYERLLRSLREHRHEDAPDLHDALLDDLNSFLEHEEYDDDMTLVVLKWRGINELPAIPGTERAENGRPHRARTPDHGVGMQ